MPRLSIRPYSIAELETAPNVDALLEEYAREGITEGLGPVVAQWWLYRKMEDAGLLHVIGAFLDDTLVGFITMVVMQRPHYEALIASYESYFVAESASKSGAGIALRNAARDLAASMGAIGMVFNAAVGSRADRFFSADKSLKHTHNVYLMVLK